MRNRAGFWATVFVTLAFAVAAGAAEVYVWVDASGVEHWSDRPPQPSKTGAESVKVVSPSFRNSSTPDVPWKREPEPPVPPPTRSQQAGKDQPANETTESTAQEVAAQDSGQAPAEAEPAQTREEQLAEAREKREAAMRRRVAGEPPPKPEVPSQTEPEVPSQTEPEAPSQTEPEAPRQTEPEVPKPANLETNNSGYNGGWGL